MKSNLELELEVGELRSTLAWIQGYCNGSVKFNSPIKPGEAKELSEKIQVSLDKSFAKVAGNLAQIV